MDKSIFEYKRKSYISIGEIFFWTASINQWKHLLQKDNYKDIIIDSLKYLSENGKIDVFAFVIMPNHIHLIWRINEMNKKETAQCSFLKFTAHGFKKKLRFNAPFAGAELYGLLVVGAGADVRRCHYFRGRPTIVEVKNHIIM